VQAVAHMAYIPNSADKYRYYQTHVALHNFQPSQIYYVLREEGDILEQALLEEQCYTVAEYIALVYTVDTDPCHTLIFLEYFAYVD